MKLSSQLIIGFILISFFCLIIGTSSYYSISDLKNKLDRQIQIANVSNQLLDARDSIFDYVQNNNLDKLDQAKENLVFVEQEVSSCDSNDGLANDQHRLDIKHTLSLLNANHTVLAINHLDYDKAWQNLNLLGYRLEKNAEYVDHYIANEVTGNFEAYNLDQQKVNALLKAKQELSLIHI